MGVTIKDIAKITGFSHTTVSRALNNNKLISDETSQKIQKVAKELNYAPNYNARSLVLDKSYVIGLFLSTIGTGTSSGFLQQTIIGIHDIIKNKYNVVVKGIDEYKDFSAINSNRFDGIIVMSQSDDDNAFIYDAIGKNIPIVVLNRDIQEKRIINIVSDDRAGGYDIVKFLVDNGHERIAIIEGKKNFKSTTERKEGYMDAMIESGLKLYDEYMIKGEYSVKSGFYGMKQLLSLKEKPSAVFCLNDDMALGAINAAYENGVEVPKDISIVGFDDSVFAEYITPSLTTIKRDVLNISKQGAKCLMDLIENKQIKENKIYIKTELILRQSVKNIKR